jgi:PAS domain S-box-containing protein
MTLPTILYFSSILMTAGLTGFLAWYAWRQPALPVVRTYAGLALCECLLALTEILSMLSGTAKLALFWFNLRFLFSAIIPVLWLAFALAYSGQQGWRSKKILAGALVIPVITQVMVWSDRLHGLWVKQEVAFNQNGPLWIAETSARIPGLWFMVHSFYSLIFVLAGIGVILLVAWRKRRSYLGQALLLVAGALIALTTTLIPVFNLLPQAEFNPYIPGIGISALLYALAIFRFQFLKRIPAQESASRITELDIQEKHSLAILGLIFILFASGLAAIGYLSYQQYERAFRLQMENQLSTIANLKVSGLEEWRAERMADAQALYNNPAFAALVQRFLEHPGDVQAGALLQSWLDAINNSGAYNRIFLLDSEGVEQVASPNTPEPVNAYTLEQVAAALAGREVTFLDIHRDTPDGPIHLALLVPIITDQQASHPLGVLVLRIDPTTYLYPFIQGWPVPSQSAETLLIRRDGNDALFLNPLRFDPGAALNLRYPLTDTVELPAVRAALGQAGIVEGADYRGVPVVADIRPVPGSPWFLVSKIDTSEIYAPLQERLWQTVLLFGALILSSAAGLMLVWRQQRLHAYQAQVETLEALRVSEEKFKLAFDTSPDAITITRLADGMFISVNQGFEQITGYTQEETIGKTSEEINIWKNPDDRRKVVEALQATGKVLNYEAPFLTRDGEIYGLMSASIVETNGQSYILNITHDITERKQVENIIQARLRLVEYAAHHSLDELLQNTLDEVCAITDSPIGFYHFVDPDQEMLSKQAWSTRTLQEYCRAEGRGLHYRVDDAGVWADCIRQRQPIIHNDYASLPHRKGLPEGHASLIRELVVPIQREKLIVAILGVGNRAQAYTAKDIDIVAYFADVAWEIAERKRAEQQLAEYAEHLEERVEARTRELRDAQEKLVRQEKLAVLGQLAGSVGHELRNPLGIISNATYLLKLIQPEASDKVKELLHIIETETRTSDKIISDLLDFTRIKSVERVPVLVPELVNQTLERYPAPPWVEVTLTLPDDLPRVFADPSQMTQVLENLFGNAYQAMPKGGQLSITGEQLTVDSDAWILIRVKDTGTGISPEDMRKIFEPLFTTKTKGIGLGLAISKRLVEANEGRIEVQSELDKGSTFTLYLPVYRLQ